MSSIETVAANAIETTTFKAIIARHSNSDVLLVHDGHNLALPTVTIPKWTRFTPDITECVLQQSGLRTISLFHPETQNTAGEPDDLYVILEPRDSSWQPPAGFRWVLRDGLRNSFSFEGKAQSLENALATADAYNSGRLHGPFAAQPSWNGWLTFEAEGSMLDERSDLATWKKAAQTLAGLQIQSATKAPALLDAGCRNLGIPMLSDQIDPFFHVMAELMARQPKVPPPMLSSAELRKLAAQMKEACTCLAAIGLPDTLGHMDFNPGNIIGSPDGCVFLDWAEAYVGHPFYTFEYLREQLRRSHPDKKIWQSEVTSCYLGPWISFASADVATRALEVTPLVAILAYALSNNAWQDAERLENSKLAGYLRSLARRMQCEAKSWNGRRQRCLC